MLKTPEFKNCEGVASLFADKLFIMSTAATGLNQQLGAAPTLLVPGMTSAVLT